MLVDFIIPTYNRPAPLKCMLASLVAQTNPDWGAHVVIDNPEDEDNVKLVESFNDPRIRWSKMDKRYNDWGHTPREYGKQQSEAKYIIMTGDDNYYTPNFVQEISVLCNVEVGMVYWDMVHSHYKYAYFKCVPAGGQIDMGAFATRRDLAQQIQLGTDFAADGWFVEQFKQKFPIENISKINKVLFVHN
jgi:glycosyltransferase involved in cell wall biosynthesis